MSNPLWTKNGKLVSNDAGTSLLECPTCPCGGLTIFLTCPSSLHTLGEGKPFSITATYAAPSASSVLPHIEITYDCDPADTNVSIVLESGGIIDFTTGWTGTLGTDEVLTFDAGNIMAVGTIMESSGTDRTCNATITAWDPNKVDTNGDPIEPVTCIISLWDDVTCSITAPSSECDGKEFSASLTTRGTGATGNLVRMDSDDGIFSDPQTRFDLYLNGIDINSDGTSKWTKGKWEGTKLSNSSSDPMEISFEEYGVELCSSEEITVKKCGISSITVTCPGCLHTLGAGDTLTIEVVYDDIDGWSDLPDVSVTPNINAIIDEDTGNAPDFSSHWETSDDTRTWTRSIRPNAIYLSDTSGSASVTFAVGSDKYVDGNGDRLADVTCTTYISDVVTCDGVTLTPMSDNPCTGGTLNIQLTLKGDCGGAEGAEGAELTYINHPPSGLFGTWPPFRFEFDITGDYEMVEDNGWVNGVYDSLIKMTGVKDELGVIENIEVTLREYGVELCYGTFTPVPCEVEATITCPENLHTLGPSKWLTITLTYTDAEHYAPLLEIELYQGASSYSASSIGLIMEDDIGGTEVATFGSGEWWLDGNVRTWRHKVQINSMPAEWEDGDAISIRVIMDYEDNSGNDVTGGNCDIALHYKVECDGEAILPDSGCVNETQDATITVKGTNGDDLVRMDWTENQGLFGSNLQFYRFKVVISGGGTQPLTPEDYSIHKNWVQGVWSCLESLEGGITPNSYTGDPVHITFEDAANTPPLVCEAEMTVEECGCTAEIDCPGNLHVYGDAKTLTIILTYTDPDLNDTHPNFYIEMAAVGDPVETLRDADGPISLADGPDWTWVGNSKTWQKDIHITGVAHTSGTTTVTIRATHINSEGVEEDLDTCGPITLSERISCSISGLPSDDCVDADDGKEDVGFSISVEGDPSETLTNWDPSPDGRFIITTSLPLPEGTGLYSGWTDGNWSVSGIEVGPGEHYVTLYDDSYPDDGCNEEFTLYDCKMTATISGCPVTVHSLGDGAEITITVYYASYDFYHPDATVSITGSAATWSGGGWVPDAGDSKKTMTGTITGVLNASGTVTLTVKDPDGNPLVSCDISVINTVVCEGVLFDPETDCVDEDNMIGITIATEGPNGEVLTRLDGDLNGRLEVVFTGHTSPPTGGWLNGVYTASMSSEANVIVTLLDGITALCGDEYSGLPCTVTVVNTACPYELHTLGDCDTLSFTATYTNPTLFNTAPDLITYSDAEGSTECTGCLRVASGGGWSAISEGGTSYWSAEVCVDTIPSGTTGVVRVDVVHPVTGDLLATCVIPVTSEIACSVSITQDGHAVTDICAGEEFDASISITGLNYSDPLTRADASEAGLWGSGGRFTVDMGGNSIQLPGGTTLYSGFTNGVCTYTGLVSDFSATPLEIRLLDGGVEACKGTITSHDCTVDISFTACPTHLHTLGDGEDLTIVLAYADPEYWDTFPTISITTDDPLITVSLADEGGALDLSASSINWAWMGDSLVWTGTVHATGISPSHSETTVTISITSDGYLDENGDPITEECQFTVTDIVKCSGGVSVAGTEVCTEKATPVSVTVIGNNGETLTRMDGTDYPGLFGSLGRFDIAITGNVSYETGFDAIEAWVAGHWEGSLIPHNNAEEVTIAITDALESPTTLCSGSFTSYKCGISSVDIPICPAFLHIFGTYQTLRINVLYYRKTLYSTLPIVEIVDGNGDATNCIRDTAGGALNFTTGWTSITNGLRWGSKNVQAHCVPAGGTATINVYDPETNTLKASCTVTISDAVFCTGLTFNPTAVCIGNAFTVKATLKGPNNLTLGRLDTGAYLDSFGPLFSMAYAGDSNVPAGCGTWSDGVFTCNGIVAGSEPFTATLYKYSEELCSATLIPDDCTLEAQITACPECLHTLGAAKSFAITATYGAPMAFSTVPIIKVYSPAGSGVELGSSYYTLTSSWSSIDTTTGIRTCAGTIRIDEIPDGLTTGEISIDVWHPVEGHTVLTGSPCTINITSEIDCSVNMPLAVYEDDPFTITITVTGAAPCAGEALTRMSSSTNPGIFGAGNRFVVDLDDGYTFPPGFSSAGAWVAGVWTCNGITVEEPVAEFTVSLLSNGTVECSSVCEVEASDMDVVFECPDYLHIYGDAKLLVITVTWLTTSPGNTLPDFTVVAGGSSATELLDDDTNLPVDFSNDALWSGTAGDISRYWSGYVRIDEVPAVFTSGEGTLYIKATHPFTDGQSGKAGLGSCDITVSRLVNCILNFPSSALLNVPFTATIDLTASNGETLSRLDGDLTGIISITESSPLTFSAGGSFYTGWVDGSWEGTGLLITAGISYTFSLSINGEVLCDAYMDVLTTEGFCLYIMEGPISLHIYGDGLPLHLYLGQDNNPVDWNTVTFDCVLTGPDGVIPLSDVFEYADGTPISFASAEWDGTDWYYYIRVKDSFTGFTNALEGDFLFTFTATKDMGSSDGIEIPDTVLTAAHSTRVSVKLMADILFTPDKVAPSESFDLTITVTDGAGEVLPRLPEDLLDVPDFTITSEAVASSFDAVISFPAGSNSLSTGYINGTQTWVGITIDEATTWEITFTQLTEMAGVGRVVVSDEDAPIVRKIMEALFERYVVTREGGSSPLTTLKTLYDNNTEGEATLTLLYTCTRGVLGATRTNYLMATTVSNFAPVGIVPADYPVSAYTAQGLSDSLSPNTIVAELPTVQTAFWSYLDSLYAFICSFIYPVSYGGVTFKLYRKTFRTSITSVLVARRASHYAKGGVAYPVAKKKIDSSWQWLPWALGSGTTLQTGRKQWFVRASYNQVTTPSTLVSNSYSDLYRISIETTSPEASYAAFSRTSRCMMRITSNVSYTTNPDIRSQVTRLPTTADSTITQTLPSFVPGRGSSVWEGPKIGTPPYGYVGGYWHIGYNEYDASVTHTRLRDGRYYTVDFVHM